MDKLTIKRIIQDECYECSELAEFEVLVDTGEVKGYCKVHAIDVLNTQINR